MTKLWYGLNSYLQSELWKDKLNPEKLTLKEVIAVAEIIEITHSIGQRPDQGGKGTDHSRNQNGKETPGKRPDVKSSNPDCSRSGEQRSRQEAFEDQKEPNRNSKTDQCSGFNKKRDLHDRGAKPGWKATEKTRLSKDEHDQRVAKKLCFGCGKPRHQANACPEKRAVPGGSTSHLPGTSGIPAYSIEIPQSQNCWESLAETTEQSDTIFLGSVGLGSEEFEDDLPGLLDDDDKSPPDHSAETTTTLVDEEQELI